MHELWVFGYGGGGNFLGQDIKALATPTRMLSAESVAVLWAGWCDLVVAVDNHLHYHGTSLSDEQIHTISQLPASPPPTFFGRRDTSGVLGCIRPSEHRLTLFRTIEEIAAGAEPVVEYSLADTGFELLDVAFTAGEGVFVSVRAGAGEGGRVVQLPSLADLEDAVREKKNLQALYPARLHFAPRSEHWCTNRATITAIGKGGHIYTYASDGRFPRALGRDEEEAGDEERAQRIEYLSESDIQKVVGGGLYTAALSEDGELFVWGQATAGLKGELDDLVKVDEEADAFVRLQELRVEGEPARGVDVAVGAAYVLVAAECDGPQGVERMVLAAGSNGKGSLGLSERTNHVDFVTTYQEITAFRGMEIKQMVCAEWSSFVVVDKPT